MQHNCINYVFSLWFRNIHQLKTIGRDHFRICSGTIFICWEKSVETIFVIPAAQQNLKKSRKCLTFGFTVTRQSFTTYLYFLIQCCSSSGCG